AALVGIILAVELHVFCLVQRWKDEREPVVLEFLPLPREGRVHRLLGALPISREAGSFASALVEVVRAEYRTVGVKFAEVVRERTPVFRELPSRLQEQPAVFLALDDPGVWRFSLHRQNGSAVA